MADNVPITPGSGADIATDDIGGVQHQRIKVGFGVDGSYGDVSSSNPLGQRRVPTPTFGRGDLYQPA